MGLDITYRASIHAANSGEGLSAKYPGEVDSDGGFFRVYVQDYFTEQADELVHGQIYHNDGESGGFRAGSYSSYNSWRDQLAELAGYEKAPHPAPHHNGVPSAAASVWADPKPGPFVELINFSDCDGVIGPRTSAKLAQDFADFQEKADSHEDEWFRSQYAKWRHAFETAAHGGCVEFH